MKSTGEDKKEIRKGTKDSVFRNLFSDKKYVLELYQALHPEDTEVTAEMITDVTIENVMAKGIFNDMGFTVRSRRLILLEAQATYTENIVVRLFLYLAETWRRHIRDTRQNHYGETKVSLPLPELYVIYTGGKSDHPDTINLSECFFPGEECPVNLQVKILYGTPYPDGTVSGKEGDIIWEFVTFCQIFNETVKKGGYTRESMLEAIRICIEQNILREYLLKKESEVLNIMMDLFNQEEITRMLIQSERREQEEETAKKVTQEVKMETTREMALKLLQMGKMTVSEIAECTGLPVVEIRKLEEMILQKA